LVLKNIIQKLKIQNKLKYFETVSQGYVQRIGEVIGELKQQDIDPDTFDTLISEKACHSDLALIYRTYQEFLCKNNLYDQEDRYILCKQHILESSFVSHTDKVNFKEFYKLSPIQQKILAVLGEKAIISNSDLHCNMKQIKVIKAPNRRAEIVKMAREISKDLQEGFSPHNLCIVLRDRSLYEHILLDVFRDLGIPLCFQLHVPIVHNPFVKALLRFLEGESSEYFSDEVIEDRVRTQKNSMIEWIGFAKSLLEKRGFPEQFCHIHGDNLIILKHDLGAYKSLVDLFDDLMDVSYMFPDENIGFKDFIAVFKMHLQSRNYTLSEGSEGIWVLPPVMLRGLKLDKIYMPGMVEGEFPRDFRPDWILKDEERAAFNERGYTFETLDMLLQKEEEAFSFIMASANSGYFSYPNVSDDNTPVLMSSYLENLQELQKISVERIDLESIYDFEGTDCTKAKVGVISDSTRQKLAEILKKQPFSATAFNMYAECPYKFFLAKVLNLSPTEEEGEYTALTKGTVMHKILETFFKNHKGSLEATKINEYADEIKSLTGEIMESSGLREVFLHPSLFEIEKKQIAESITAYIDSYLKQNGNFKPILFEMDFGFKQNFSFDFMPDILFSGKIDRIDEDSGGRLVIFDYKSGSTPDIRQIEEGTNLQMPLYMMACEQLLKKPVVGGPTFLLKKVQ